MSSTAFMAFLLASFVLAVTPGPGVLYIVTRTFAQGRAAARAHRNRGAAGAGVGVATVPRTVDGGAAEPEDHAVLRRLPAAVHARRISGLSLIALGVMSALAGQRQTR